MRKESGGKGDLRKKVNTRTLFGSEFQTPAKKTKQKYVATETDCGEHI